jgi:hypothetical protein
MPVSTWMYIPPMSLLVKDGEEVLPLVRQGVQMYRAADALERTVCKRGASEYSPQGCDERSRKMKTATCCDTGEAKTFHLCAKGFKCTGPPMPSKGLCTDRYK